MELPGVCYPQGDDSSQQSGDFASVGFRRPPGQQTAEVDHRRDRLLVAAQPLIGRLSHAPGLVTVIELLDGALDDPDAVAGATLNRFASALAAAMRAALAGQFHRLSWDALLAANGDAARGGHHE